MCFNFNIIFQVNQTIVKIQYLLVSATILIWGLLYAQLIAVNRIELVVAKVQDLTNNAIAVRRLATKYRLFASIIMRNNFINFTYFVIIYYDLFV
jgi:hypothetical protein